MKDSRLYLVHVRDCLTRIRDYIENYLPGLEAAVQKLMEVEE